MALVWGLCLWNLLLPVLSWVQGTPSEFRRQIQDQVVLHTRQATTDLRLLFVLSTVFMALVEEIFFRGYLWEALAGKLPVLATILTTAVLFSLAHVVTGGPLGMERLLPGLLLGLVIGALRARSGSVLPGMLLHAVHNGILGVLSQSQSLTARVEAQHDAFLIAALAGAILGAILLAVPSTFPRRS